MVSIALAQNNKFRNAQLPKDEGISLRKSLGKKYHFVYKPENYGKKHSYAHVFQYLTALNQPLSSFESALKGIKEGDRIARLNAGDPLCHNINALALAALFRRQDVIEFLVRNGADPLQQDKFGYSALHYAAMEGTDLEFLDILRGVKNENEVEVVSPGTIGQLQNLRDQFNGTAEDLVRLTQSREMADLDGHDSVVQYETADGDVVGLSAQGFQEVTNFPFRSFFKVSPELLMNLHEKGEEVATVPQGSLRLNPHKEQEAWERFVKEAPPLVLFHQEGMGLSVKAGADTPAGSIVTLFTGEYSDPAIQVPSKTHKQYTYSMGNVDPTTGTNLGPMINDGVPNIMPMPVKKQDGLPLLTSFITLLDVQAGEPLYFDYGSTHTVKDGPYVIPHQAYERLQKFFTGTNLMAEKNKPTTLLEAMYKNQMVRYVGGTPSALIRLHLDGTLKVRDTLKILTPEYIGLIGSDWASYFPEMIKTVDKILKSNQQEKTMPLLQRLTQRTVIELFVTCMKEKHRFTSKEMDGYLRLGEIYDDLYLFVNGVLAGDLRGMEDAADYKEQPLNFDAISEKYQQLTSDLRAKVCEKIKVYIGFAKENNLDSKIPALFQLLQLLKG